jgi:LuxR family transcriptional regulator of csgAB operon
MEENVVQNTAKNTLTQSMGAFLIASPSIQNELLSYMIFKEFKITTTLLADLEQLKNIITQNEYKHYFILINALEMSFENVLRYVQPACLFPNGNQNNDQFTIAMYNLHLKTGVEEKALYKGIKGFFYKDDNLEILKKGISFLLKGELWISRNLLAKCALNGFKQKRLFIQINTELTKREIEILTLISMGITNEEIAEKICVSSHTVKTHLYNIYKKINVKNRLQAAIWASKYL